MKHNVVIRVCSTAFYYPRLFFAYHCGYPCDNISKYLIYTAASQLPLKSALWSDTLSGKGVLKRI